VKLVASFLLALTSLAADVRLPKYTREVLPNGVVVYLVPRPGLPLVNFRVAVKGGVESDPDGLAGLSSVTAQLLRKGTARRTADQFSNELDGLGGTFGAFANDQSIVVTSGFLKKDFDAGLDLTADAILHPSFPDAEVKKSLSQGIDAAKNSKDSPQAAIGQYFRAFFFGPNHPYGHPTDEASLGRMTRDRIAVYAKENYVGKNLIVIVAGDFDSGLAASAVKKVFGDVPAGAEFKWPTSVGLAQPKAARLLLIDKPDATQTYFRIAQPGITRTDPERTTVRLLDTLFGGRFTSLLNDALRVNGGLTYGASSILDQNREQGALTIASYTRTETTEKAIDLALEVLKNFNTKGVTPEQLASVKAYTKGTYPTRYLETATQIAGELQEMELFGLNRGEVDDMFSRIDAVTLEQANAITRKRFRSDNLTFVVLGNASKIRDNIRKYAPEMKEVSIQKPGFGAI
jgi:zinc protease